MCADMQSKYGEPGIVISETHTYTNKQPRSLCVSGDNSIFTKRVLTVSISKLKLNSTIAFISFQDL